MKHTPRPPPDRYDFFCCTQSLLFENAHIDPIMAAMHEKRSTMPVDHILVDYVRKTGRFVYVSVPSLFQHVGAYSTLAERTMDPPEVAHESWSWQSLMQHAATRAETTRGPKAEGSDAVLSAEEAGTHRAGKARLGAFHYSRSFRP